MTSLSPTLLCSRFRSTHAIPGKQLRQRSSLGIRPLFNAFTMCSIAPGACDHAARATRRLKCWCRRRGLPHRGLCLDASRCSRGTHAPQEGSRRPEGDRGCGSVPPASSCGQCLRRADSACRSAPRGRLSRIGFRCRQFVPFSNVDEAYLRRVAFRCGALLAI